METHFGRAARATPLSMRQMELVVGSLLGDATLLATTSGFCFRVHHGLAQSGLVDWKYDELRCFVRTPPRQSGTGYYFRTVTHPILSELRSAFYSGCRKIVPFTLLERHLTAFAMAVWIMDDGAIDGAQMRLNTQSFTIEEARSLAALLEQKFGSRVTVNFDKGKPRLRFARSGIEGFLARVRPFILPEMRYKMPIL